MYYSYLELSYGYGRKRKTVRPFDWCASQSIINSSGISNVYNTLGSSGFAREDGFTTVSQFSTESNISQGNGTPGGGKPGCDNPGGGNPGGGNPGGGNPGGGNPGGGNPGGGNPGGGNPGGGNPGGNSTE